MNNYHSKPTAVLTLPKTEIMFYASNKDSAPVLKPGNKWSSDVSHILVTVMNLFGHIKQILLTHTSDRNPVSLRGISREHLHCIQVYGLKLYHDKHDTVRYPKTKVFSVEEIWKTTIIPGIWSLQDVMTVTMKKIDKYQQGEDCMMSSVGKIQNVIDVEIEQKPPLHYSLKVGLSAGEPNTRLAVIYSERLNKEYLVMTSDPFTDIIPLLPVCQSRTDYRVRALTLTEGEGPVYHTSGTSKIITLKTCMVRDDLCQLMAKAAEYCQMKSAPSGNYEIKQFYRNKPSAYYDDIWNNHQGVMKKYSKDNNGDPHSPINGMIDGLFFSASLVKGKRPPNFSFFGDTRLFIPAEALLTEDCKLYFADFFCHYDVHYATIVITKKGSVTDNFCEDRLIELDKKDNPFLKITETNTLEQAIQSLSETLKGLLSHYFPNDHNRYLKSRASSGHDAPKTHSDSLQETFTLVSAEKFHVEFFYTEDVDISGLMDTLGKDRVFTKHVQRLGRGGSKKEGIPKCLSCKLCNLDPASCVSFNSLYI